MAKIESKDVRKYLDRIRSFKQDLTLYDCHVHPFEALFCDDNAALSGRGNVSGFDCVFTRPETGAITESDDEFRGEAARRFKRAAQVLTLKKNYQNACPECFLNHMAAAAVDVSLLLPIAAASGEMETAMGLIGSLYGRHERFLIGCSVPNTVAIHGIDEFLARMKSAHQARAVKLHPNITEIDLAAFRGKERAEAILAACRKNNLALVVHGGRSTFLKNPDARSYGCIANMEDINWSLSENAVVIAHGGAYECTRFEVEHEVLPVLIHLLSRHANLFIDMSGLDSEIQIHILRRIGPERIVFGSDALYSSPWREAAKLVYSLERAGFDVEESYLMIGSQTPEKALFKRMEGHVQGFAHTAVSSS